MLQKEYIFFFFIIGLNVAYGLISLILHFTGKKRSRTVKKKITVGTALVAFSSLFNSWSIPNGSEEYKQ